MTELVAVSPPTDWLGVAIVVVLVLVFVAIVTYAFHVSRSPGKQFGEEEIEKLADRLHVKLSQAPVVVTLETQTFDGKTFTDQASLDEYKAAKAIMDKYQS